MPDIVQWLRLKGDASGLKKAANEAGESLTKSFFKANIAAQAVTKATELLTGMIREGAKAALEYEKTTTQLTTALRVQGREVDNTLAGMQAAAGRYEELSGISDEVIRGYQAQAIALGKSATETDELIRASLVLSQVTGRDLRTSFESLLKTEQGLIDRTIKMVPAVASLTKEQLAAGDAVRAVNEEYSEFIDINTRGGYGALTRLKNEFANVGEEVAKLGNEQDGFIVQLNRALGDLFEWQRRILSDSSLSQWERLAFMFAPFFDADAAAEYQKNLKLQEEYARRMVAIQEKIDKREGRAPPARPSLMPQGKGKKSERFGMEDMRAMLAETEELVRESTQKQFEIIDKAAEDSLAKQRDDLLTQAEWRMNYEEKLGAWIADKRMAQAELQARIDQEAMDAQSEKYDLAARLVSTSMNIITRSLIDAAGGAELSAKKMAVAVLKGVGIELIGKGNAYILEGLARLYLTYWSDPTGWGLVKTGGLMVASGTGLAAGAAYFGRGAGASGGGGGATGGSVAPGTRGTRGSVGVASTRAAPDTGTYREPQNVTIVFQGPQTPEGVGVAVHAAIAKARAKGLLS